MPETPLTPGKRRIEVDPETIEAPPRAPFVELGLVSCFSFLRGASDAVDLVSTARALGYDAIGIAGGAAENIDQRAAVGVVEGELAAGVGVAGGVPCLVAVNLDEVGIPLGAFDDGCQGVGGPGDS